jgi:hypothetical protein
VLELGVADDDLSHGEANTELGACDEASSKLVEVTEEFTNTNALLTAHLADTGKHIIDIIGGVAHDFGLGDAGLGLREVVE